MIQIGFTGTRLGMTPLQLCMARDWLAGKTSKIEECWLHHGQCVGADAEMHVIAREFGWKIAGHPPKNQILRDALQCDVVWQAKPYLVRNREIVNASSEILAAPASDERKPSMHSGTWATIRYARSRRDRLVTIIYPDGSIEFSP